MSKQFPLATLLACLALAGCDVPGGQPLTGPDPSAVYNMPPIDEGVPPIDDGGCCTGGDTGDGGGGGTTPPPAQYRLVGQVYQIEGRRDSYYTASVKMRGWSRFEKLVGSDWVKVDASTLSIQCYGGGASDQDSESPAGFTDVEFWIGPEPVGTHYTVQCHHSATHNGVNYTATSSAYVGLV